MRSRSNSRRVARSLVTVLEGLSVLKVEVEVGTNGPSVRRYLRIVVYQVKKL